MDTVWTTDLGPLVPFSVLRDGHVALLALKRYPVHMGFVALGKERPSLIHAYGKAGRVVEHGIDAEWHKTIKVVYKFREP
jgi:hypothetical protein